MIKTQKYIRKPLYVDAVRVTEDNFDELVGWCQGEVLQDDGGKQYIKVRVQTPKHSRQTKAFVGDWLLYTDQGYKVYTHGAFCAVFDAVAEAKAETQPDSDVATVTQKDYTDEPIERVEESDAQSEVVVSTPQDVELLPGDVADEGTVVSSKGPDNTEWQDNVDRPTGTASKGERFEVVPVDNEAEKRAILGHLGLPDTTPQGEQIEYVEATPKNVMMAVQENEAARAADEPTAQEQVTAAVDSANDDVMTVLSVEEQNEMGPEKVRELLKSGDYALIQDQPATS